MCKVRYEATDMPLWRARRGDPAIAHSTIFFTTGIALAVLIGVIAYLVVRRWYRAPETIERPSLAFWVNVYFMVWPTVSAWFFLSGPHSTWFPSVYAVLSILCVTFMVILTVDWRGWGKHMWEWRIIKWERVPPYTRPGGWPAITILVAAPLALWSDLLLFIYLLFIR